MRAGSAPARSARLGLKRPDLRGDPAMFVGPSRSAAPDSVRLACSGSAWFSRCATVAAVETLMAGRGIGTAVHRRSGDPYRPPAGWAGHVLTVLPGPREWRPRSVSAETGFVP